MTDETKEYIEFHTCKCDDCIDEMITPIPSGYEWNCPHCSSMMTMVAMPKASEDYVECETCTRIFPLGPPDHVHE